MRNDERRGSASRDRNGMRGPARRSYGEAGTAAPRVGAVYRGVPAAERVDAGGAPARRGEYRGNGAAREGDSSARTGKRDYNPLAPGGDFARPDARRGAQERFHREHAAGRELDSGARGAFPRESVDPEENENLLAGRNPIREALKAGRSVEKLLVAKGDLSGAARDIVRMAREAGAVVQEVDRSRLDAIYPAHQGLLAYVAAVDYVDLDALFTRAAERGEDPFFVLLDGVTDPHNLGAILRTAECAGAHGAILPERRAAGLGPAAAKAAAGALDCLPVARVKNLNRTIDELKERGVWVIGTAMAGEDALTADLTGPVALVIGSEGEGVSRLTLEKCDRTLTLPMRGRIESLNASVAAGILMYEVVRARSGR